MPTELDPGVVGAWREYMPLHLPVTLSGALATFSELGYHGTSVRDIAQRAGVTVPALYYHHKSKQGILVALLDLGMSELLARARAALDEAGESAEKRFTNLIEAIVLHMTYRVELASLDSELRYLEPDNRAHYAALRGELQSLLESAITAGVSTGVFHVERIHDTTRALLGMLAAIASWYRADGTLVAEQIASHYVAIALNTVGARRP